MGVWAAVWADQQAWAPSTEKRERYVLAQWTPQLGDIPARALTPADIRPVVLGIERNVAADLVDVLAPAHREKYAAVIKPAEIAEPMRVLAGARNRVILGVRGAFPRRRQGTGGDTGAY
ncbi:MAG: hypothetical protein ACP5P4_16365, partial [Steroidobacteraceae bacterium]